MLNLELNTGYFVLATVRNGLMGAGTQYSDDINVDPALMIRSAADATAWGIDEEWMTGLIAKGWAIWVIDGAYDIVAAPAEWIDAYRV